MINSYQDAKALLNGRTTKKLANNTYARLEGDNVVIKLHDTDIITYTPKKVILTSGGWNTVTTKERLNRFCPANIRIYQENSIWYVGYNYQVMTVHNCKGGIFYDGIEIKYTGEVYKSCLRYGDKRKREILKLKKQVKTYLLAMDNHFKLHGVPEPSSGDCWYCCMYTQDKKPLGEVIGDKSHLISHLKDKYIIGSLINNALISAGYSSPGTIVYMKLYDSIKSAVRRYFYRQLGIA